MNKKIAAVLLAATMLTTPVFAASVATSPNTPTALHYNKPPCTTAPSIHPPHYSSPGTSGTDSPHCAASTLRKQRHNSSIWLRAFLSRVGFQGHTGTHKGASRTKLP